MLVPSTWKSFIKCFPGYHTTDFLLPHSFLLSHIHCLYSLLCPRLFRYLTLERLKLCIKHQTLRPNSAVDTSTWISNLASQLHHYQIYLFQICTSTSIFSSSQMVATPFYFSWWYGQSLVINLFFLLYSMQNPLANPLPSKHVQNLAISPIIPMTLL